MASKRKRSDNGGASKKPKMTTEIMNFFKALDVIATTSESENLELEHKLVEDFIEKDIKLDENSNSPLHNAAMTGKLEYVKILLNKKANVNVQNRRKRTALHMASRIGHVGMVEQLLKDETINVDLQDFKGRTALHVATYHKHLEIVVKLLKSGAKVDVEDKVTNTPLCYISSKRMSKIQIRIALELLKYHKYPLHAAVEESCYPAIKKFLRDGMSPNVQNEEGDTPLHIVAQNMDIINGPIVRDLLKYGAKVDMENYIHKTPLITAVEFARSDLIKKLVENGANVNHVQKESGSTPLRYAIYKDNLKIFRLLLELGAKVKVPTNELSPIEKVFMSPLHEACIIGRSESKAKIETRLRILQEVLQQGAEIDVVNKNGETPLCMAMRTHQGHSVKMLLQYGANPNRKDRSIINGAGNSSVLHEAIGTACYDDDQHLEEDVSNIKELLRYGANINALDDNNMTPLHIAIADGKLRIAHELLNYGPEVNTICSENNTPLSCAIDHESADLVEMLLRLGADPNFHINFNAGESVLNYAVMEGHMEIVAKLLKYGAETNFKSDDGFVPLEDALQFNEDANESFKIIMYHLSRE